MPEQSITRSAPKGSVSAAHGLYARLRRFVVLERDGGLGTEAPAQREPRILGSPDDDDAPRPISWAAATARTPIGPEPWMTTVSPTRKKPARWARSKARTHEVNGSERAPRTTACRRAACRPSSPAARRDRRRPSPPTCPRGAAASRSLGNGHSTRESGTCWPSW